MLHSIGKNSCTWLQTRKVLRIPSMTSELKIIVLYLSCLFEYLTFKKKSIYNDQNGFGTGHSTKLAELKDTGFGSW